MNVGTPFHCSYTTHMLWNIAPDKKAICTQTPFMNPVIHQLCIGPLDTNSSISLQSTTFLNCEQCLNAISLIPLTVWGIAMCQRYVILPNASISISQSPSPRSTVLLTQFDGGGDLDVLQKYTTLKCLHPNLIQPLT